MSMQSSNPTGIATFVRTLDEDFTGDARLYRLEPPITYPEWGERETAEYVIVSAVNAFYTGPETYIFAADENGNVLDWGELDGSFRGSCDHNAALSRAGYGVVS